MKITLVQHELLGRPQQHRVGVGVWWQRRRRSGPQSRCQIEAGVSFHVGPWVAIVHENVAQHLPPLSYVKETPFPHSEGGIMGPTILMPRKKHHSPEDSTFIEGPEKATRWGEWEPIKIPHRNLAYIPKTYKSIFSLKINKITSDSQRSPSSLPHMIIGTRKLEYLAHSYSKKYEMKLESGKEPHLLKGHIYRPKQKAK
jgi:hypothetical protein